ncbi:MAG: hypothetical protein IPM64_11370 [Phycisphaerales bacterium]|nr:hypothetical protein [Phycisphaerales bacterium]
MEKPTSRNTPTNTGPSSGAASRSARTTAAPEFSSAPREALPEIDELAPGSTRIQDTVFEERDDVLSVINELEDQLDRYQELRGTLERDLVQSTEQLNAAQQKVQELEWQAVTLQTRIDALEQIKQEVGILEEQVEEANVRASRLAEQVSAADKENTKIASELKTANKQLEELWAVRKERDGLRGDLRSMRGRLDELERSQRETMEERASLQSRVQETQLALEESRATRLQLEQNIQIAHERIGELQRMQKSLEERLEAGRVDKKNLQAQIGHLERENARLVEQRQFYESELTGLRNANRQAETALVSMKKAFAEVRIAVTETRTRARRRTMDLWPRIGSTGSGLAPSGGGLTVDPAGMGSSDGRVIRCASVPAEALSGGREDEE